MSKKYCIIYTSSANIQGFAIDVKETIGTVMTRIKKAEGEE